MGTIICKCIAFFLVISSLPISQEKKNQIPKVKEKEKLIGIWGKNINENANFQIEEDSIYYVDANQRVKYITKENSLKKDSIIIYYDGYPYRAVYWFRNDSLILKNFRESKFVRFKKDQQIGQEVILNNSTAKIKKDVQQKDSIFNNWRDKMYKNWKPSNSMPYFILDKQIELMLKNPELSKADSMVINCQLVYDYYLRRYIYDSIQYRDKAFELLFKTINSDKYLIYSSAYFKTTPAKMEQYLNEIKNIKTNKLQDSLVWRVLNSYQRLKAY